MNNDVLLVPVTTVQPDLQTQTDAVVYVPLASKTAHGIVKIGDGLNITTSGVLSFDKLTSGLDNVDNTSDLDKPISNATQEAIDILETDLTDLIMDTDDKVVYHINDFNNPHKVTKEQVGLSNVDNTSDLDKPVSTETQKQLLRLERLISGSSDVLVYDTYKDMITVLNADSKTYGAGQSIYIGARDVPDLWIYAVMEDSVTYTYTNDEDVVNKLSTDGDLRVGYYVLHALETGEINISNVVTLDTVQNITGTKVFTEQIGILNGVEGEINYIKHINNNFLISSSDGENIINIDEQLKTFNFYNKPLALEEYVENNYISYTTQQSLTEEQKQIARNNIGAGTEGGGSADLSDYVTLNTRQTITGKKTINADFDAYNTSSTGLYDVSFRPDSVRIINQDNYGNGCVLMTDQTKGVDVSTSGSAKFTYNGKEVSTGISIVWWEA